MTVEAAEFRNAPLGGLFAAPIAPRGLILALHGSGQDAGYWHHPACPANSLLDLGAKLGFEVLGVDRAGYGRSRDCAPQGADLAKQIDFAFATLSSRLGGRTLPVFAAGHSAGGIVALAMAANPRGSIFQALDISGVPLDFGDEREATIRARIDAGVAAGQTHTPVADAATRRAVFYGPDGSFDPALPASDHGLHPAPFVESRTAVEMRGRAADLARRIAVPVRWTEVDHESAMIGGQAALDNAARLFAHNSGFRPVLQCGDGHHLGLHRAGRAHHLRVIAFFEEVLASRC